mmetsp:Transcript_68479/g.164445  ORF Transcript_68479/g.164445 Transcript_68479/m.164445 type:complete len:279 (-) Transcript_68479:932-1768(-)
MRSLVLQGPPMSRLCLFLLPCGIDHVLADNRSERCKNKPISSDHEYHKDEANGATLDEWIHHGLIVVHDLEQQEHGAGDVSEHALSVLWDVSILIRQTMTNEGGGEYRKGIKSDDGEHHDPEHRLQSLENTAHELMQRLDRTQKPSQAENSQQPEDFEHLSFPVEMGTGFMQPASASWGANGLLPCQPHRGLQPLICDTKDVDCQVQYVPSSFVLVEEEVSTMVFEPTHKLQGVDHQEHVLQPTPSTPRIVQLKPKGQRIQSNNRYNAHVEFVALDPR